MSSTTQHLFLADPYKSFRLGDPNAIRVSYDVSRDDVNRIRTVVMDHGCLAICVKNFIKHIADYARTNNFTLENRDDLLDYVRRTTNAATVDVPIDSTPPTNGPSSNLPNGQRPNGDDRPGTGPIRQSNSGTVDKPTTRKRKQAVEKKVYDVDDGTQRNG